MKLHLAIACSYLPRHGYRMTVSADGKTMTVVDKEVRRGTTAQSTIKQP